MRIRPLFIIWQFLCLVQILLLLTDISAQCLTKSSVWDPCVRQKLKEPQRKAILMISYNQPVRASGYCAKLIMYYELFKASCRVTADLRGYVVSVIAESLILGGIGVLLEWFFGT